MTDNTGALAASYSYGAWGETLTASHPSGWTLNYLFVGALGVRFDSATGLHYMRNRWYDAGLGRFLSRDALGGLNRYEYCLGNPINLVDVNGLAPEPPGYHVTTGSGGENLYYNDASYYNAPNQIPPSWRKTRETRDVNRYSNTDPDTLIPFWWPLPKIKVPDIGKYPLPNYDIGPCPEFGEPWPPHIKWDPKIPPPWPPIDAHPERRDDRTRYDETRRSQSNRHTGLILFGLGVFTGGTVVSAVAPGEGKLVGLYIMKFGAGLTISGMASWAWDLMTSPPPPPSPGL